MLPRYLPEIDWPSWRDWLFASAPAGEEQWRALRAGLGGDVLPPFHREYDTLRAGLVEYFSTVRGAAGSGAFLVPAQICRAVPLAIERAGLAVRYVDIDPAGPTPGAAAYAAAIDEVTVGVVVAPLYGHIHSDWSALLAAIGRRVLVLDLAQGFGLAGRIAALARRADAVGYSFGLGKGLDTGGALLLTRAPLDVPPRAPRVKAALADPLLKAVALNALAAAGCYRPVAARLDQMDAVDEEIPRRGSGVPPDMCRLWLARLPRLDGAIALARSRALHLGASPSLAGKLRDATVCFDAGASHLRQLIRVPDAARRDTLVSRLRVLGVDCAPAGEPLPEVADAARRFPHAVAFRAESVRLPFLGRLAAPAFEAFVTTLERAVDECLR